MFHANTPTENSGLLLNDDDDAPVPLVASRPAPTMGVVDASTEAGPHLTLAHPSSVADMQAAVDWVCSCNPYIGIRRWFLKGTGVNFGPCRRERELRRMFRVMYRTLYHNNNLRS